MPIIDNKQAENRLTGGITYDKPISAKETQGISWAETIGTAASVGTEYIRNVGQGISYNLTGINDIDPTYNAFDADVQGYEEYSADIYTSKNSIDEQIKKQQIDRSREKSEKFAKMGSAQTAVSFLAAGLTDPSSYVGLGFIRSGAKLTENLARVAAPNVALVAGQEAIETRFDPTRNIEDAAINTAMAGAATLLLGGGAHFLNERAALKASGEVEKTAKDIKDYIFKKDNTPKEEIGGLDYIKTNREDYDAIAKIINEDDSVGAARYKEYSPEDYISTLDDRKIKQSIKDIKTFDRVGYSKILSMTSTSARLMQSNILGVRELAEELLEIPYYLTKNDIDATSQAFETIQRSKGDVAVYEKREMDAYKAYGKELKDKGGKAMPYSRDSASQMIKEKLGGAKPESDFRTEVAKALRRNDVHPNPHVEAASKEARRVLERIGAEAERVGVLVRGAVKTAESYLPRAWEKYGILYNREKFVDKIANDLPKKKQQDINAIVNSGALLKDKITTQFKAQYEKKKVKATAVRDGFKNTIDRIDELEKTKLDILGNKEAANYKNKKEKLQAELDERGEARRSKLNELVAKYDDSITSAEMGIENLKAQIKILSAGRPKKPETLVDYVIKSGGLADDGGEVSKLGYKRVGFLRKDLGENLDDAALSAWEQGFIDQADRPTIQQFLDMLENEIAGNAYTVRAKDYEQLDNWLAYDERFAGFDKTEMKQQFLGEIDELETKIKQERKAINKIIDKYSEKETMDVEKFEAELLDSQKAFQAKYSELANDIKNSLKQANKNLSKGLKELDEEVAGLVRRRDNAFKRVDKKVEKDVGYIKSTMNPTDLKREAEDITDHILGLDENHLDFKAAGYKGSATKSRVLDWLRDEDYEDFLVNDPTILLNRYARQVGGMTTLYRKFGTANPTEIINKRVKREYSERVKLLKTEKEKKALTKEYEKASEDLNNIMEIFRGAYRNGLYTGPDSTWKKIGRAMIGYNFIRYMGGFVFSNLPDAAGIVRKMGVGGLFKNYIEPIRTASKGGYKAAVEDIQLANLAVNGILSEKNMSFADLGVRFGNRTAFDKFMHGATATFSKVALIDLFNDTMDKMVGIASQNRIMRNVEAVLDGGKLSKQEKLYMNTLGLDDKAIQKIGQQRKYFEKDGDMRIANLEKWDNVEALDVYRAALKKDASSMYIQTTIGDKPMFANSSLGQVALQFRSFIFSMQTRVFLSSLQQRDAASFQGMVFMLAMGGLSYVMKEMVMGREPDLSADKLAFEAFNRSGLGHVFMEANDIYEAGGGYGLGNMMADGGATRFYDRKLVSAVLGPSLSPFDDFEAFMERDGPEAKAKAMRRLVPFNNIFYTRWLISQLDEDTQKAIGYYEKPIK